MHVSLRLISLQILLLCPALLQAQDTSQKPVFFKSGTIYPPGNFEKIIDDPSALKPALFSGHYYVVIQFSKIPNEREKLTLKKNGVELIDYLPELAYTAVVSKKLKFKCLKSLPIRSFFRLEPRQKLSAEIVAADTQASRDKQVVEVNLITFQQMSVSQIQEEFMNLGVKIVSEQTKYRLFELNIPKQNLQKVASLPFVQWIEPVAPPDRAETN